MADMIPVDSSMMEAYGYDGESATLYIRFRGGECYEYFHVPSSVWDGLQAAPSKGRFFNDVVRRYDYGVFDC